MRKALCIGVSKQEDSRLISIPQCENDILDIEILLNHNRSKFQTLTFANPTYFELIKWISENIKDLNSDDELLIYFQGMAKETR
jgi:hypothetical protein